MDRTARRVPAVVVLLLVVLGGLAPGAIAGGNVDLPRYPSISPDGSRVAFSWRGDLWKAPVQGGEARRLTAHPADDTRSAWSLDGQRIAFNSTRSGYPNIFEMRADGTEIRRITVTDERCTVRGYGLDAEGNEAILFDARIEGDPYQSHRPYAIAPEGGDPVRLHDAFGSYPAVSPDGRYIAFVRNGYMRTQLGRAYGWHRRHYRGPERMQIWLYDRRGGGFTQLTEWEGDDGKPRWADDRTILFLSDREDRTVNLYRMRATEGEASVERLTRFDERDIHQFDVSADGRTVVFNRWDGLYRLDLSRADASPQRIAITASEDTLDETEDQTVSREVSEAALSPDGKVMATVAYGRVFVRAIGEHTPTRLVTPGHDRNRHIAWSPDGTKLYFSSDADGTESIYAATVAMTRDELVNGGGGADADKRDRDRWQTAIRFDIEPVVQWEENDQMPQPSACGRYLSFKRAQGRIMVLELANGREYTLVDHWDAGIDWRISPDGNYVAYSANDMDFSANVFIVPIDGSAEPVDISSHSRNCVEPRWSADGRVLVFRSNRIRTGQRQPNFDVYAVHLDRELDAMPTEQIHAYYAEAARRVRSRGPIPADPDEREYEPRRELDLEDAYRRVREVFNNEESVSNVEVTPCGGRIVFNGQIDGSWNAYSIAWDGSDRRGLGGSVSMQHMTPSGDQFVFVRSSRAGVSGVRGGGYTFHDIDATLTIDLAEQSEQKLREAARTLSELFYEPDMSGTDWPRLTDEYADLARRARTREEFKYVGARLFGELDRSHLGFGSKGEYRENRRPVGRLGVETERAELGDNTNHAYRVTQVYLDGPAGAGAMRLIEGDLIVEIELEPFGPGDTMESKMEGRVGEETIVTVRRDGEDRRLLLHPVSTSRLNDMRYDAWVDHNARLVDEWSGGRVGYVHIQSMNQPSLDRYMRDMYAAARGRDGLIIDVRNNGGGWTADRILASLIPGNHAYTIQRGADRSQVGHYPQDRVLMPRFTGQVNMLSNTKSHSNAEIISHGFQAYELGNLVGEQTYGGVISTGSFFLIDGTRVRLPGRGWYLHDGTDMDNNGAIPDIHVPQRPEAEVAGEDEQLRVAVEDIMERLDE